MIFTFGKFKLLTFLFFIYINLNTYSFSHIRGTYTSKQDALEKSLELDCIGIHKNKDKWLPCQNEEELHKYLRK